jgi:hypothetical protein
VVGNVNVVHPFAAFAAIETCDETPRKPVGFPFASRL